MSQNTANLRSSDKNSQVAMQASIVFSAVFLAILAVLHFLEPEFDPSWRMISEYELGRLGWLMSLAFFCWSGSVLAVFVSLSPSIQTVSGTISRWWLFFIGIALIGAGIFKTDPITEIVRSTAGVLHTVCGAIVILTFPIAASSIARSLATGGSSWRLIRWATLLVWIGLLAFFASIIISHLINPEAGRVGPAVLLGWPNRLMVVTYNL